MVRYCIAIVVGSLATLIGMGFQPGWANGWPGGISQDVVFASFVTAIFAATSLSGVAALLTVPCIAAERRIKRPFVGWTLFIAVLTIVFIVVGVACPHVFASVRASMAREST